MVDANHAYNTADALYVGKGLDDLDVYWFEEPIAPEDYEGYKELKNKLKNKFIISGDILITRERHRQHLEQSLNYLKNFEEKNEAEDFDKAAEDLRLATRHLGMIVGKVDV